MLINDLLRLGDDEIRDRRHVETVMWCLSKPGNLVAVLCPCIAVKV